MIKQLADKYFSIVKTFIPEKRVNKPSVGLDIGSSSCKAIEIMPIDGGFTILNWLTEPLDPKKPADAVKKIIEKLSIEVKSIATAVGGQGTLIRYIDMPKMPLADAKKSFALEADKYFPFAKEQIYTDCFIVDSNLQENKMSLLVAAAKKEIIDQRMKLLTEVGLQADFIGLNSLAIANVFNVLGSSSIKPGPQTDTMKASAVAILDIGNAVTSLIILKDGVPRFTRDIFVGGRELNERIGNVLGVDVREAEKIKRQPGAQLENVLNASDSILMNLVSEIRLSFDYFVTEKNTQVSKLYLTGGSSAFEKLVDFFGKNLEIPVEKWNPLGPFKLLSTVSASDIQKNASYLGVALGLALYQQ